jgi:hypothetical protein
MPTATKGDYHVGYGKPPSNAGFKKGQSGNPRGRPPRSQNLAWSHLFGGGKIKNYEAKQIVPSLDFRPD